MTGSLQLAGDQRGLAGAGSGRQVAITLVGLAFILVGIAFKFGAVPFHMWLPDVYRVRRPA